MAIIDFDTVASDISAHNSLMKGIYLSPFYRIVAAHADTLPFGARARFTRHS